MPPDDRREGAPQILRLRLTLGPTRLNHRLQAHPVRVRQHCPLLIPGGAKRPSSQSVQARTGPSLQEVVKSILRPTSHTPVVEADCDTVFRPHRVLVEPYLLRSVSDAHSDLGLIGEETCWHRAHYQQGAP